MASASSSAAFLGVRGQEAPKQIKQQHQQHQSASSTTTTSSTAPSTAAAPQKKKRNLPGTPNPDAEVIALSPRSLLATNRFICEVCNKGFQREQNLQLHRRGHNLPWKLKQKTPNEVVRKKVYLCPEPTCVHHDPSRPLGDLTGIKKHYCRKHGEKKWKCDKCSKKYAVQSDWKAHSKTCGTREYRCDCGTLFSRRDSFITHRAFCDALAQETSRLPTGLNNIGAHLLSTSGNNMALGPSHIGTQIPTPSTDLPRLGGANATQFDHLFSQASINRPPTASQVSSLFLQNQDGFQPYHGSFMEENKPFHGLMQLPHDLLANTTTSNAAANLFNLGFFSSSDTNTNGIGMNSSNSSTNAHLMSSSGFILHHDHPFNNMMTGSFYGSSVTNDTVSPQMSSATALLQKAAQMSGTTSNNGTSLFRGFGNSSLSTGARQSEVPINLSISNFSDRGCSFGDGERGAGGEIRMNLQMENNVHLQDVINSLATNSPGMFATNAGSSSQVRETGLSGFNFGRDPAMKLHQNNLTANIGGSDGLTRDFLGVGEVVSEMGEGLQQRVHRQHCMGNLGSFEPEMK